ncbi:MAG TPA: 50S ribosomal protein L18 [Candidatus Parcubacteria bacterium]|nr:50S ribosomal protein L18 [Candidatus Parcubacteria bacterium]
MLRERQLKRIKRHRRVRAKISGTGRIPRLCVFRSINHIYAQLIDDEKGRTLISASDKEISKSNKIKKEEKEMSQKIRKSYEVGKLLAKKALEKNIKKAVFDRGGYVYHGRVRALAEGAREGGLDF